MRRVGIHSSVHPLTRRHMTCVRARVRMCTCPTTRGGIARARRRGQRGRRTGGHVGKTSIRQEEGGGARDEGTEREQGWGGGGRSRARGAGVVGGAGGRERERGGERGEGQGERERRRRHSLDRHVPASEGGHLGSEGNVRGV